MKVFEANLADLIPREQNPRTISSDNFKRLVLSLSEFGQVINLVINKQNEIISGNQRYRAMTQLGWEKASVLQIDVDKDNEDAINIILNSKRARGYFVVDAYQKLLLENKDDFMGLGISLDDFTIDGGKGVDDIGINFLDDDELGDKHSAGSGDREEDSLIRVGETNFRISKYAYDDIKKACLLQNKNPAKVMLEVLNG